MILNWHPLCLKANKSKSIGIWSIGEIKVASSNRQKREIFTSAQVTFKLKKSYFKHQGVTLAKGIERRGDACLITGSIPGFSASQCDVLKMPIKLRGKKAVALHVKIARFGKFVHLMKSYAKPYENDWKHMETHWKSWKIAKPIGNHWKSLNPLKKLKL